MKRRTPVVVFELGHWVPGEVLAWWRHESEWIAQVRTRDGFGGKDKALWVVYDPALILPVHIGDRDFDWWLPSARLEPDGRRGPG